MRQLCAAQLHRIDSCGGFQRAIREKNMNFCIFRGATFAGCCDSQLVDVVVFDVDVQVVLLQEAVHAGLELADVLLHLVVVHAWWRVTEERWRVNHLVLFWSAAAAHYLRINFSDNMRASWEPEQKPFEDFKLLSHMYAFFELAHRWQYTVNAGPAAPLWMVRKNYENECRIF